MCSQISPCAGVKRVRFVVIAQCPPCRAWLLGGLARQYGHPPFAPPLHQCRPASFARPAGSSHRSHNLSEAHSCNANNDCSLRVEASKFLRGLSVLLVYAFMLLKKERDRLEIRRLSLVIVEALNRIEPSASNSTLPPTSDVSVMAHHRSRTGPRRPGAVRLRPVLRFSLPASSVGSPFGLDLFPAVRLMSPLPACEQTRST